MADKKPYTDWQRLLTDLAVIVVVGVLGWKQTIPSEAVIAVLAGFIGARGAESNAKGGSGKPPMGGTMVAIVIGLLAATGLRKGPGA